MLKQKRTLLLLIVLLLILGVSSFWFFLQYNRNQLQNFKAILSAPNAPTLKGTDQRLIDGIWVSGEEYNLTPISIMMDNSPQARPHSGLAAARLVIEAPVESRITRIMAVFDLGTSVEKIGPVRSARPYFLDYASEFSGLYAHVGGSPDALARLKRGVYEFGDLNEFYHERLFWRDGLRFPPHNVYTSTDLLDIAFSEQNIPRELDFETWMYKDDAPSEERGDDTKLDFDITGIGDFETQWTYSRQDNTYQRRQGSVEYGEEAVFAKNVIIQFADVSVIDSEGRKDIQTIGRNDAILYRDGIRIQGYWNKKNEDQKTRFYTDRGNEIPLNRGLTWIHVVDVARGVDSF